LVPKKEGGRVRGLGFSQRRVSPKKLERETDFESIWLEAILTGGALNEADLILLLKRFGIGSFEEYAKDPGGAREMAFVLINKATHEELLDEVRRTMEENYADRLSFEEAAVIYRKLDDEDLGSLMDLYTKKLGKPALKHPADAHDLIVLILGELCKIPREEALSLLH